MGDLTRDKPKPLLRLGDKNLLEHKLDRLPPEVGEVIIVVGYLGHLIKDYFGDSHKGREIKYVQQSGLGGTGSALLTVKDLVRSRFMVMMGDDIYGENDFKNVLEYPWAMMANQVRSRGRGAKIQIDNEGTVLNVIENTELVPGDLANAGLYVLGPEIFSYPLVAIDKKEFGLPQMVVLAAKDFKVKVVRSTGWVPLSTPGDLSFPSIDHTNT